MVTLKREGSDESELCDNGPGQFCSCVQELDQRRRLLLESGEETEEMAGVKQGFSGWQEPGLSRAAFPPGTLIISAQLPISHKPLKASHRELQGAGDCGPAICLVRTFVLDRPSRRLGKRPELELQESAASG